MKSKILGLLAVALLAGPIPTRAVVIYDNFDPGGSLFTGGYLIGPIGGTAIQGFQFTAAATAYFDSLTVVASKGNDSVSPQTISFHIYSDASNTLGSLLETVDVVVNQAFNFPEVVSGTASGSTLLSAGTNYWLVAESATVNAWRQSNTGVIGLRYWNQIFPSPYLANETLGAFRISGSDAGTPVPEPGTLALLGLGLAGLGLSRRRKAN